MAPRPKKVSWADAIAKSKFKKENPDVVEEPEVTPQKIGYCRNCNYYKFRLFYLGGTLYRECQQCKDTIIP
jgi:hypothetical protein